MTENGCRVNKKTTYYPFALAIAHAKGMAIKTALKTQKVESAYGDTEKIYSACTYDNGEFALFVINKSDEDEICTLDFASSNVSMKERLEMTGELHDYNDFDHPNRVVPVRTKVEEGTSNKFEIKLPKHSFTLLRFSEV